MPKGSKFGVIVTISSQDLNPETLNNGVLLLKDGLNKLTAEEDSAAAADDDQDQGKQE